MERDLLSTPEVVSVIVSCLGKHRNMCLDLIRALSHVLVEEDSQLISITFQEVQLLSHLKFPSENASPEELSLCRTTLQEIALLSSPLRQKVLALVTSTLPGLQPSEQEYFFILIEENIFLEWDESSKEIVDTLFSMFYSPETLARLRDRLVTILSSMVRPDAAVSFRQLIFSSLRLSSATPDILDSTIRAISALVCSSPTEQAINEVLLPNLKQLLESTADRPDRHSILSGVIEILNVEKQFEVILDQLQVFLNEGFFYSPIFLLIERFLEVNCHLSYPLRSWDTLSLWLFESCVTESPALPFSERSIALSCLARIMSSPTNGKILVDLLVERAVYLNPESVIVVLSLANLLVEFNAAPTVLQGVSESLLKIPDDPSADEVHAERFRMIINLASIGHVYTVS